jgi:hypothetical protein
MISPRADVKVAFRKPGVTWALVAVAWLGVASGGQAQVDGWGTDGGPGTPPTTYTSQSAFGVTTGSSALQATTNQGGFWGPSTGNLVAAGPQNAYAALRDATRISFDLTLIGTQINGGSQFSGFAQDNELAVQLFSNPGGTAPSGINQFIQRNFAAGNGTDTSGQNATWSGVDGTRTITFDLTTFTYNNASNPSDPDNGRTLGQVLASHPDIQDAKIDFTEQIGGGSSPTGNFFYDNVRLLDAGGNTLATIGNFEAVPEPSSLALAALGMPVLIRAIRRRRRSCPEQSEAASIAR